MTKILNRMTACLLAMIVLVSYTPLYTAAAETEFLYEDAQDEVIIEDTDVIDDASVVREEEEPESSAWEVDESPAPNIDQQQWSHREYHRAFRNQSLLASVGLCSQQGSPECHDGGDGYRIPAKQNARRDFFSTSRSYHHRPEWQHGSAWFPRYRDSRSENCRTD